MELVTPENRPQLLRGANELVLRVLRDESPDREIAFNSTDALFVIPSGRGNGFHASIRGHLLELADPDSEHALAPTPEDLLVTAIASDVAWFVRGFLREQGLDDHVSISAWPRTSQGTPRMGTIEVRVEVSNDAAAIGPSLTATLERRFAAQSPSAPRFQVRTA